MKLYVVRHGETMANADGVLQGSHINGPLTEIGIKQMEMLIDSIPQDIEVIYCSSLQRVMQSAEILNRNFNVEIKKRDELREREYGSLAGKTWSELGELKEIDEKLQFDYRPFGGESVEDVEKRLRVFLEELKKFTYSNVLVVTSRGPIRQLYHLLEHRIEPHVPNGSLHLFEL